MMAKNNYWNVREQRWIKQRIKNDEAIATQIERQLNQALKEIQKEVNNFYAAYAKSQGISLADAMNRVKRHDVKAFEDEAKRMVLNRDFSDYANSRLKLYNSTMKINQLEYLKSQIGLQLVDTNSSIERIMKDNLNKAFIDEANRQAGILGKHRLNDILGSMKTVVNSSFNGATWSQRIWANSDNLKSKLEQLITKSMIQGVNPNVLARELSGQFAKEFKNSSYMAKRLLVTETARVQDEAQMKSFERNNIEYVKWIAEPSACEECLDIANANDGIYPIAKVQGIPIHPGCRCSKSAYVPKDGVEDLLQQAKNAEPLITSDLSDITNDVGTHLEGLDYKIKSYDSLLRKVTKNPNDNMRDVVRYTSISKSDEMVSDYRKIVEQMKNRGYTQTSEKNSWIDKRNPYNGLNTNFKTSRGYEFELQFHTKESFKLKNGKLHKLYEKQRVLDMEKDFELYENLTDEMWKLSNLLKKPFDIDKIGRRGR